MSQRIKSTATLLKLFVAAVVAVLLYIIIVNAMTNPVDGRTRTYTADFTDVSGLHVDGDVRSKGVQVGKVTGVGLMRDRGRTIARVKFTLQDNYKLADNTVLAIKYQNLTGVRYIDFEAPAQPGKSVDYLPAAQTRPSFDITQLFNGLQPVLQTMSTDDINAFMQNTLAVLQGDGGGLAPMLDSVQKLANLARDRQTVVSTLAANLSHIADSMGGRSPQVMALLHAMEIPIDRAMTVLNDFQDTAVSGPEFLSPVHRLFDELGINGEFSVDQLLQHVFSSLPVAADALRLLPVTITGLQIPQQGVGKTLGCSHGAADLPTDVKVLLNGSEVVLCNG